MIRTQTAAKELIHDATATHNLTRASKLMGWNFTLKTNNTPVIISNAPSIDTALFFEPEQFGKVNDMSNGITVMCNDTAVPEEGDRMSTTEGYSVNI